MVNLSHRRLLAKFPDSRRFRNKKKRSVRIVLQPPRHAPKEVLEEPQFFCRPEILAGSSQRFGFNFTPKRVGSLSPRTESSLLPLAKCAPPPRSSAAPPSAATGVAGAHRFLADIRPPGDGSSSSALVPFRLASQHHISCRKAPAEIPSSVLH